MAEDGRIRNTGNSRLLRIPANLPITSFDELMALLKGNGLPTDLLLNYDGWENPTTMMRVNKNSLLKDETANALGLTPSSELTPNTALLYAGHIRAVSTGTASALTVSVPDDFTLIDGTRVQVQANVLLMSPLTLKLGALNKYPIITARNQTRILAVAGAWLTVAYSASLQAFVLQGDAGGALRFGNDPGQISTFEAVVTRWKPGPTGK